MATITVQNNEDIYDVANRVYKHPLGVHWLIEDNDLDGITTIVNEGHLLKIRDGFIELIPIKAIEFKATKTPEYAIDEYQSIFDVAIEKHGDIEGVFRIVEENGFDGLTEYLWPKRALKVESEAVNKRLQKLLANYMPIATIEPQDKSDGIGFMYVEINFIVR